MELLVMVSDKGDAVNHAKRGDVVVICEDGWCWTQAELENKDWAILRSDIVPSHAGALMQEPHIEQATEQPYRLWGINFSLLPASVSDKLNGDRSHGIVDVPRDQLVPAIYRKTV